MTIPTLNNVRMNVVETSPNGVVNEDTIFEFTQTGNVVSAKYSGGKILQGFLIGTRENNKLTFSYCQLDIVCKLDNGISACNLSLTPSGKIRLIERFEWSSRDDKAGLNVFEELSADFTSHNRIGSIL